MTTREIKFHDVLIAVVVQNIPTQPGVYFLTPPSCAQQLGYQLRNAGETVALHAHERGPTVVNNFAEVLIVKRGRMYVRLFSSSGEHIEDVTLLDGDMILLEAGAHEILFQEETELYEVKQGPYIGPSEKRFLMPLS